MKFDFVSQRIVAQLDNLYMGVELFTNIEGKWDEALTSYSVSKHFRYDFIYDHLVKDTKIEFTPDVKQHLWSLAIKCFEINEGHAAKEGDNQELHRYYKSYLVKKYLLDKLPERMFIYNEETGQKITRVQLRIK